MKNSPFLDDLKAQLGVSTDKALGTQLGFSSDYMSDLRTGRYPFSPAFQIAVLEATNWTLWEMRKKMKEAQHDTVIV